jgi:Ca-activated chloride channel family protein
MIANTSPQSASPEFSVAIDRSLINVEGGSVRHLVLTVRAPEQPPTDRHRDPLNLGLVIDASGSMAGPPLDAAKSATLALLDRLADDNHLSVVSFASDVITHAQAVRLDQAGRKRVAAAVRPLVTRGNTAMFDGWVGGCEAVAQRQAAADTTERNHVILLSDGHANEGECRPERLAHHAAELRKRGVLTSTVGIGRHYSPIQLQAIAEAGGGRMHDAEEPNEIAEIMLAELSAALTTTVDSLEFTLRLPRGVTPEIYGTTPLATDAEGCDILAGSVVAGATRRIVVKLTMPPGTIGDRLSVTVSARWKSPSDARDQAADLGPVELRFDTPEACVAQPRCRDLAKLVAEQWQAHIYHRAMRLNQDGDFRTAAEFSRRETRFYNRYCVDLPEMQASVSSLHEFSPTMMYAYDAVSAKEVMLRSYKTSRGESDHRSFQRQTIEEYVRDEANRQRRQ